MLWTVIGTFVGAQVAMVAGVLYVVTLHLRDQLKKALDPIERDLHDLTRDMGQANERLIKLGG